MNFGHVGQVASNDDIGVLLRCPRCGWLYLDPMDGLSKPRHVDAETAASGFGFST